jgi:carbon-monoxide dehydrogenase medium subunit
MTLWKNYILAATIADALQSYASARGAACWIAGGTDLLLDLQQGRHGTVDTLVDITAIPALCALEIQQTTPGGVLYIGAGLPLNRIVASPLVLAHAQALVEACRLIGGPQVRNTATLGGNVAHALPAGDGAIALMALGAQAEVADADGRRVMPLDSLYLGPGHSWLADHGALLLGFQLPLANAGQGSAFRRVMRPQGVAIAIMNMGVWVQRRQDLIEDVRIAVGPAGPVPFRAMQAEQALRGSSFNEASLAAALQALLQEARFRTSPHRATKPYRRHLAGVLLEETLQTAWQRAARDESQAK